MRERDSDSVPRRRSPEGDVSKDHSSRRTAVTAETEAASMKEPDYPSTRDTEEAPSQPRHVTTSTEQRRPAHSTVQRRARDQAANAEESMDWRDVEGPYEVEA